MEEETVHVWHSCHPNSLPYKSVLEGKCFFAVSKITRILSSLASEPRAGRLSDRVQYTIDAPKMACRYHVERRAEDRRLSNSSEAGSGHRGRSDFRACRRAILAALTMLS